MTSERKTQTSRGISLAIAALLAANPGCVGFSAFEGNLLAGLGLPSGLLDEDGGNVVISYANGTKSPVQWRLAWQRSGSLEPTVLAVTIQPGQTKTLAVEGTVERVALGSLDGWSVAAVIDPGGVNPHTVTYGGGALENGVDFQSGDIIRCGISDSGGGKYLISAEVAKGG
ncbi:MAG: hypothetical protein JXQ73_00260 [Phycisphaerae bacterium]|nr:hypothetical protein [Phycisphaerae bacterium]